MEAGQVTSERERILARNRQRRHRAKVTTADGWREWGGGAQPCKSDRWVEVRFAGGGNDRNRAKFIFWGWSKDYSLSNVVAWRPAKVD